MLTERFEILEKNYQTLEECDPTISSNFTTIFSKLQKTLFTGISAMVDDLFIFQKMQEMYLGDDIYMKLKILKLNCSEFKELINPLFDLRNIIVHRGILKIDLIQNVTINLIKLFKANLVFWSNKSFNIFSSQWISIYNKILSDSSDRMSIEVVTPFILKSYQSLTFRYYRDNGHKEQLKGKNIKIISGKWEGNIGIMLSWNGTCVYCLLNEVRIKIPIDTLVEIL